MSGGFEKTDGETGGVKKGRFSKEVGKICVKLLRDMLIK